MSQTTFTAETGVKVKKSMKITLHITSKYVIVSIDSHRATFLPLTEYSISHTTMKLIEYRNRAERVSLVLFF